jgi:hypothetical protein
MVAAGGVFEAGDQPQQRGLAAARRADEDDELAVGDARSMPGMTWSSPKDCDVSSG